MDSKILDFHSSSKVPVFVKAQEIIDQVKKYSVEEIVGIFDELSAYGKEIAIIKRQIIEVTYPDIVSTLIEPIDSIFEEEYKSN